MILDFDADMHLRSFNFTNTLSFEEVYVSVACFQLRSNLGLQSFHNRQKVNN